MQSSSAPQRAGQPKLDRDKIKMLSDTQLADRVKALEPLLLGVDARDPGVRASFAAAVEDIGNRTITDYRKALKTLKGEQRRRDSDRRLLRTIPWTPFHEAVVPLEQLYTPEAEQRFRALVLAAGKGTWEEMRDLYIRAALQRETWLNSRYQVEVDRLSAPPMVHLSIKRRDQQPVHDWRDLQRIKNELVGPEFEGIELYPAESRVVDTANQYHLWVVAEPGYRFEIGWNEGRLVMDHGEADGVGQRELST